MSNTRADRNEEVFLATTALEEFWDKTKPIVFLGEWCLLHGRRSFWEPVDGHLLESPYDSKETVNATYHYVNKIYELILPLLGDVLNTIHEVRYSERYWRIVIGPWLQQYLSVCYDRYIHLKRALEQYPNCSTLILSESSFVVSSDTLDYCCYLQTDSLNLQIYTKILLALGKNFPCKEAQVLQNTTYSKLISNSWTNNASDFLVKIYAVISAKIFKSTFLKSSYFSRSAQVRILIKSAGMVLPIMKSLKKLPLIQYDSDMRNNLKVYIGDSEFEKCLGEMLFSDMPTCFLEGYGYVYREAQHAYPKDPKGIFSANAWYFDEVFKQWAAASAEKGTLLIGTPHGGNYGSLAYMPGENHETAIVDRYYSWGWNREDCVAEVIPFPASKLVGREKYGASNLKNGILWAGTSSPRYLLQLSELPKYFQEYLSWHRRFANTLLEEVMANVRFRPHYEDYSWGIVERLRECVTNIKIESWDVPFQESLINCRLYVCDHLSTTFAEALSANRPTILFWNPQANELRPDAQPYYDLLRKNGILYDSPESAGLAVNKVYDDVEAWWNNPERQNAVETFCKQFARNSPDAIDLWTAEFKRIDAMPGFKAE